MTKSEREIYASSLGISEEAAQSINFKILHTVLVFVSKKILEPAITVLPQLQVTNKNVFFKKLLILVRKLELVSLLLPRAIEFDKSDLFSQSETSEDWELIKSKSSYFNCGNEKEVEKLFQE